MKSLLAALFLATSTTLLPASDQRFYNTLNEELRTLEGGAGDVWANSGDGGYLFKFEKDVIGDDEKELFVNFSFRPYDWHLFSGKDRLGTVRLSGFDFITTGGKPLRIVTAYRAKAQEEPPLEPFGRYIIEQVITENGVERKIRQVGTDATEEEFASLASGNLPLGFTSAKPDVKGIRIIDFLLDKEPKWFSVDPAKVELRNGYNRFPDDQIMEANTAFTPTAALKMLGEKDLREKVEQGKKAAATSVRKPPTYPAVPVAIGATFLALLLIFLIYRSLPKNVE